MIYLLQSVSLNINITECVPLFWTADVALPKYLDMTPLMVELFDIMHERN